MILLLMSGCASERDSNDEPRSERVVTVEVEPVQERSWQLMARAVGSLTADEQARIRNEVSGIVRDIKASEGDPVGVGDVLLRLDDERMVLDVQRADARYREAQAVLERRRPLFEKALISEAEMIEAEANFQAAAAELGLARRRLSDTVVRATIGGTLGRRYISRGDYAEVGARLFDLVKLDQLKLDFDLPERYLSLVAPGQQVRVRTGAYPDRVFDGEVYFVDPLINLDTRTVSLRARVDNRHGLLRPNLFVNVELDVTLIEEALVIPEQAVISDLGGFTVYVVDADDRAEIRSIRPGEREPGWVQVLDGLSAGEKVVASGHQRLQPGLRVRERDAENP